MRDLRVTMKSPPRLNLVEWADKYRYLSSESSSLPGKWKTSRVEVARGPMLAITDPNVRRVTVMGPTQLMKSSLLENTIGYYAHQDPSPILLAQPTATLAEAFGKDRIDKMFRDSPALSGLIAQKKSRDSGNTLTYKAFPGGYLALVGSNSPTDLSSRPIRIALMDEVDKYPESAGKEGDVVGLITERTATFFDSKVIVVCSPTVEGRSRIAHEYEQGDKRVYHVPCPHCGHTEEMNWANVKWPEDEPDAALYHCPECKKPWTEPERVRAVSSGHWVATAPFNAHASFRCSKLVSPWEPVNVMARKWVEAKGKPEKLKVFVNTQLAETWLEKGEAPDHQRLYERREEYTLNTLDKGVVFLTAGADVQKDRIEVEIVGWGRDKQSWSIDYRVLMGDTSSEAVWTEFDKILNETWLTHDKRELQVRVLAVDSGYNTQSVYNWARRHSGDRVRIIKGVDNSQTLFGTPRDVDVAKDGGKVRRAVKLWPVGVSVAKSELYGWLKLDKPEDGKPYPAGYCHFPQYDLEHFKRLCSEQLMNKTIRGRKVPRWEQIHERNEQLDCRVYARAAAAMFGLDRMSKEEFDILEGKHDGPSKAKAKEAVAQPKPNQTPKSDPTQSANDFWARQKNKKLF
jgi:phage terminase large subunit GpA-like protein